MNRWRQVSTWTKREAIQRTLRKLKRESGVPTVFGGLADDRALRITELLGARTAKIRDLVVRRGAGLGGRVLEEGLPREVENYQLSPEITHDYDEPVAEEGLKAVAAAPVHVPGHGLSAILYAGLHRASSFGHAADELMRAARRLAFDFAVQNEVDRRLSGVDLVSARIPQDVADLEGVREVHAELRSLAHIVTDPEQRRRLEAAAVQLAMLGATPEGSSQLLSIRELDVLSQVALGLTNRQVAARLGLRVETVKSYLRSAMSKLHASTRQEAVVRARALALLP